MKAYWLVLPFLVGCADLNTEATPMVDTSAGNAKAKLGQAQPDNSIAEPSLKQANSPVTATLVTATHWDRTKAAQPKLVLANTSNASVNFTIRSGMVADFALSHKGEVVWRYSEEMMFTQVLSDLTIAAAAEQHVSIAIPANVLSNLAAGSYRLHASVNAIEQERLPAIQPVTVELL
ncbi:BsuPI-related putative proteinase inhibitor [Ferrimonas lipolytica]|uniref:Intracellular proteinase inhibitor BsuPI domain-containing protein n=1 Tax=Ferrimonas lipolytica TaxID=2724191 RepID=A0A6H1UDC1_9GAMM|nr:BsuPI-related putative proteinase inhibitor [Ferrimonas lipolytica]QIZ76838.1 hypothetical protein HER31_08090 [Ferrimonas lipolytica]